MGEGEGGVGLAQNTKYNQPTNPHPGAKPKCYNGESVIDIAAVSCFFSNVLPRASSTLSLTSDHSTPNELGISLTTTGKTMQRSSPLPPSLHGENGMRFEEQKVVRGMHEGSHRVGSVQGREECVL